MLVEAANVNQRNHQRRALAPQIRPSLAHGLAKIRRLGMSVATRSGLQNTPCPSGERLSDCSPSLVEGSNPQFTKRTKKMNSENITKVTNETINQLAEALNAGHSDTLTRYLAAMAKFRTYSFFNLVLILKQCPKAT